MIDPLEFLRAHHGITEDGRAYHPGWADHHSETPFKPTDHEWVSQPYVLRSDAWHDFAILEAHGYRVKITGKSTHDPSCMTVHITGGTQL